MENEGRQKRKERKNVYYVRSLQDVRVYRLVLIARRKMTRRTSFSCWNEGMRIFFVCFESMMPLFHFDPPQESARFH